MHWPPIKKSLVAICPSPNLLDYEKTCANFSWNAALKELTGLQGRQGLNIGHEAIDRHAKGKLSNHLALRWLGQNEVTLDFTYRDLQEQTNRFANVLQKLGIGKGDMVFCFTDKIPALYFAALGTLKNTSIFCPLFSVFGPEAIYQRMRHGDAQVLVTTTLLYHQKIASLYERLPKLQHVLLADAPEDLQTGVVWSLPKLMDAVSSSFTIPPTDPKDIALLHFTSGTTGMPKGALHAHYAVLTHYVTAKYVLDFHPDDIFWCTADPGWVTGISYGIIAPLVCGVTTIIDSAKFNAEHCYQVLEAEKISIWYTFPTAIRQLMSSNIKPLRTYDLRHLRTIHSVGEPLNPEAVLWGRDVMGLPIHDNWWQTETGGIMIANYPALDIRPGSMGLPLPGIEAAIVQRHNGEVEIIEETDTVGELALRTGWPSMFLGYLHEQDQYDKCFVGNYYLTGDLAQRDADGYYWFVGRTDDIIKSAGHLVSPFEVESALMTHPAVAEVGVIGKPDALLGEVVKAFVVLKPESIPNDRLRLDLRGYARRQLGQAIAPVEIEFTNHLPKNKAGKIMRRLLKAREIVTPEGDISTLET